MGLKLRLHPLFFLIGILSAFTGGFLGFLAASLCALEHEAAHAFVAARYGYRLDRVVLMPYGAVLSGDLTGMRKKEELAVLLAGPLANLATGLFFVALWWFFPETYPYTELAAAASFSLFFVNLLPAYPLDGGRMLRILLQPLCKGATRYLLLAGNLLLSLGALAWFAYSCFSAPAWTTLAFGILLAAGAFGGGRYARIAFSPKKFTAGVEERRVAISSAVTAGEAVRFLRSDRYLTLLVFEGGSFCGEIAEEEFLAAPARGEYGVPLGALVA